MVLFALGGLVVWLLTFDLEESLAVKWMTDAAGAPETSTQIFTDGQYGIAEMEEVPRWIATQADALPSDTTIFSSNRMGAQISWSIPQRQAVLWNDYVRHTQHWAAECDTLFVIYGPLPDSSAIYAVNLCVQENSQGQGFILPNKLSDLPLFNFTMPIDRIERMTKIDFFKDLIDPESEAYIEATHQRLQWSYPEEFYQRRIEENKLYANTK